MRPRTAFIFKHLEAISNDESMLVRPEGFELPTF